MGTKEFNMNKKILGRFFFFEIFNLLTFIFITVLDAGFYGTYVTKFSECVHFIWSEWRVLEDIGKYVKVYAKKNYILYTNCFFLNLLFCISSFLGNQTLMMSSSVKILLEQNEYGGNFFFVPIFLSIFSMTLWFFYEWFYDRR